MERVHGVTVKAFLDSALVRPSSRALLARDIGLAIARLHDGGIIHGDLTTSNVMLRGLPHPRGVDVLTAAPPLEAEATPEADAAAAAGSGRTEPEALATSSLAAPTSIASSAAPPSVLAGADASSGSSSEAPASPSPVSLHLHFPVVIIDYGLASMSAAVR
jgi:serine/threonine protein kinase